MKRYSFVDVRVWEGSADHFFPDKEAMIRRIDQPSLVPFLPHLPAEYQGQSRGPVIDRMIQRTRQQDERCLETFRRINVFARKPDR